MKIGDSG